MKTEDKRFVIYREMPNGAWHKTTSRDTLKGAQRVMAQLGALGYPCSIKDLEKTFEPLTEQTTTA